MLPGAKAMIPSKSTTAMPRGGFAPMGLELYLKAAYSQERFPPLSKRSRRDSGAGILQLITTRFAGEGETSYDDALACAQEALRPLPIDGGIAFRPDLHYDAFDSTQPRPAVEIYVHGPSGELMA
jgi:hypothetical protein